MATKKTPDTIYFARPIPMMGSKQDKANLKALLERYPEADVVAVSKKACMNKKSMRAYFRKVDKCDAVVIVESQRNHVSSGVHAEALHAQHDGKPVLLLRNGKLTKVKGFAPVDNPEPAGKWAKIRQ